MRTVRVVQRGFIAGERAGGPSRCTTVSNEEHLPSQHEKTERWTGTRGDRALAHCADDITH